MASGSDPEQLIELLMSCMHRGSLVDLAGVKGLFASDYGGATYKWELKSYAGLCLFYWGELGIRQIVEVFKASDQIANQSMTIELLAMAAAQERSLQYTIERIEPLWKIVEAQLESIDGFVERSRSALVECMLSFKDESDVSGTVGHVIFKQQFGGHRISQELVKAMAARWFTVSVPLLNEFRDLIAQHPDDETVFQEFLTSHPQFLDPMAIQVWPQPNIFGSRYPDFVVRRSDGSYIVVEIECPSKALVTKIGKLSAHATHAEYQAMDYRRYMLQHNSDMSSAFPNFEDPECLVVVGLEEGLSGDQIRALKSANEGRHKMRICGFDWLLKRAEIISNNIARHGVEVTKSRIV